MFGLNTALRALLVVFRVFLGVPGIPVYSGIPGIPVYSIWFPGLVWNTGNTGNTGNTRNTENTGNTGNQGRTLLAKSRLLLAKRPTLLALTGQKVLNQVVLDSPYPGRAGSVDGGDGSGGSSPDPCRIRLLTFLLFLKSKQGPRQPNYMNSRISATEEPGSGVGDAGSRLLRRRDPACAP